MSRETAAKWVISGVLLLVLVSAVSLVVTFRNRPVMMSVGDKVVYARLANNDSERTRGLSGSSQLADDQAMLFVFDQDGRWGVWMKDMRYSLDILWLDSGKKVVDIAQNVSPNTYPTVFSPKNNARYVVELPAGFTDQHQVSVGQAVGF